MTTSQLSTTDVVIIGAGPAGCAAGVFCARGDLETVVIANGRSTLQKCAYVENYLGFPAGLAPHALGELSRTHARTAGCTLVDGTVARGRTTPNGFAVVTDGDGPQLAADFVIATSWSDSDYLEGTDVETDTEAEDSEIALICTDDDGRTAVDGLYAAGRITGTHHQALVNAGDGARVALTLINDLIPEFYNDWVALEGYYAHYGREVPTGVEEIDHDERRRRIEAGRNHMRSYFGSTDE